MLQKRKRAAVFKLRRTQKQIETQNVHESNMTTPQLQVLAGNEWPGSRRRTANFTGLVLGCIEANFYK